MRNLTRTLALGAAMALAGCFSLESEVSKTTGEEHVVAKNYGWSLFNCIPVCCGNVNAKGRVSPWAFFRDDVTMDKMQNRFFQYAAQRGHEATDVAYHNYDTVMFGLPLMGITIPIPYVITYKEIQISGVLK